MRHLLRALKMACLWITDSFSLFQGAGGGRAKKVVNEFNLSCQDDLLSMGELDLYSIPDALNVRNITVQFLGLEVLLPVRNWRDELFFRFAVMMKQRAIAGRLLRALPWELALGTWDDDENAEISDGLIKDFVSSRVSALSVAEAVQQPSLKQVQELLEGKRDMLLALDRSFVLELLWVQQSTAQGAQSKLETRLLAIFDGAQRALTLAGALEAVQALESDSLYHYSPPSCRAIVTSAKTWLQQLLRGICPENLDQCHGFLANIINRLARKKERSSYTLGLCKLCCFSRRSQV